MQRAFLVPVVASFAVFTTSCGGGGGSGGDNSVVPPPSNQNPVPPPPTVTSFAEVTAGSGVSYEVGITPSFFGVTGEVDESTFGGAAAGDCDRDGDIDLFITYGDTDGNGPGGPNRLYVNMLVEQGNGLSFVDMAQAAGIANTRVDDVGTVIGNDRHSGPTFADMDGDGDLDLFLGGLFGDPNKIYENRGDCTFEDVTSLSPGIENMIASHTISAAFGDFDLDGDLDLFITHWGTADVAYAPEVVSNVSEHLWENVSNESGIRFVNVSVATNVAAELASTRERLDVLGRTQVFDYSFTPTFARMDADPWPDIVIAGDFGSSLLLRNHSGVMFEQVATAELSKAEFGMGSALGDYDHDGDLDLFVTSVFRTEDTHTPGDGSFYPGNRFFENQGGAIDMVDVTDVMNVADGGWGWAACFLDIDNDGDLDLYHTNGWIDAVTYGHNFSADESRVFVLDQGAYAESAADFGLAAPWSGRGAVCADFDNDGDVDILELTDRSPNSGVLWENRTAASGNNYLRVQLHGQAPNTEAAGARVYVKIGATTQMREVMIGSNYISQNPAIQVFGLGPAAVVDEVRVVWPARSPGPVQPADTVVSAVPANQTLAIVQNP